MATVRILSMRYIACRVTRWVKWLMKLLHLQLDRVLFEWLFSASTSVPFTGSLASFCSTVSSASLSRWLVLSCRSFASLCSIDSVASLFAKLFVHWAVSTERTHPCLYSYVFHYSSVWPCLSRWVVLICCTLAALCSVDSAATLWRRPLFFSLTWPCRWLVILSIWPLSTLVRLFPWHCGLFLALWSLLFLCSWADVAVLFNAMFILFDNLNTWQCCTLAQ